MISLAQRLTGTMLGPQPPAPSGAASMSSDLPPEPIRTRTMARLLSKQGHHARALTIYDELTRASPDDAELAREARECEALAAESAASLASEGLEDGEAAVDEMLSTRAGGGAVRLSWKVSDRGVARAERVLAATGELTARLVIIAPDSAEVVRTELRERPAERRGEWLVTGLPEGARTTAAIGLRSSDAFVSIAHCASAASVQAV